MSIHWNSWSLFLPSKTGDCQGLHHLLHLRCWSLQSMTRHDPLEISWKKGVANGGPPGQSRRNVNLLLSVFQIQAANFENTADWMCCCEGLFHILHCFLDFCSTILRPNNVSSNMILSTIDCCCVYIYIYTIFLYTVYIYIYVRIYIYIYDIMYVMYVNNTSYMYYLHLKISCRCRYWLFNYSVPQLFLLQELPQLMQLGTRYYEV